MGDSLPLTATERHADTLGMEQIGHVQGTDRCADGARWGLSQESPGVSVAIRRGATRRRVQYAEMVARLMTDNSTDSTHHTISWADVHALKGSADPITATAVHRSALAKVASNVGPLQYVLLPTMAVSAIVLRRSVNHGLAAAWVLLAAIAAAMTAFAVRHPRRRASLVEFEPSVVALGSALAVVGTATGFATWVGAAGNHSIAMLLVMFPALGITVGTVSTAGRLDMYLSYVVPTALVGATGEWFGDGTYGRITALLLVLYAVATFALFAAVSRSTLATLRVHEASVRLAADLAEDREALSDAYDQLRVINQQLEHLAFHDPLTGLYNRRGTLEALEQRLNASDGRPVALLFCDLDRFKAVNELLGHRGGDQFLLALADRIGRSVDSTSIAGRIGGDEFVVVLPDHDVAQATAVAARLVQALAQPVQAEGRLIPSSVSVGVAGSPAHGSTSSDLLRNANTALFRAKTGGRNRVEVFTGDMQRERQLVVDAEHALRRAIDDGLIMPFFQPEIDATTGRIVGAELLARWMKPDGSVVDAADFIEIARSANLLERLTERVLSYARPDIQRLASLGLPDGFRFRINLAPGSTERSLRQSRLDDITRGIDPSLLVVDVREAALLNDLPTAAAILASFRARGGRVCLEDFARGVSSLTMLRKLPIDEVRVDRTQIDTIVAHPHDRAIVRSVIGLVQELGLDVTADGIETGAQCDVLIALGCVRHQGYLYAPALSTEQFEAFLLQRQAEGYQQQQEQIDRWIIDQLG